MQCKAAWTLMALVCAVSSARAVLPPYFEGFESEPSCATNCNSTCVLSTTGWLNEALIDDQDWLVDQDGTASSGTGPTVDHTLGTSEGNYLYVESTGACADQTNVTVLISPPLELHNTLSPEISFWYHMFGADMGTLHVDVLDSSLVLIQSDLIPPFSDNLDAWQQMTADISAFVPLIIHVRFRYVHSGTGFEADVALDDFEFNALLDLIFMDGFEDKVTAKR